MAKKLTGENAGQFITQLDRMIEVSENSMIINLALRGVPQQEIRKMVQCDMRRITKLLKPVQKYIKKYLNEQDRTRQMRGE